MAGDNCPSGCSCDWKKPQMNERLAEFIRLLDHSENYIDQAPGRSGITGQQHALRCAGLGFVHSTYPDAAFIGLVHDLGRPLNDVHHGEVIAEMVRDRVSETTYDILRTHGTYQAAIVHDTDFPEEPWSKRAKEFAGYEVWSFQDDYTGPVMTVSVARLLLELYLGDSPRDRTRGHHALPDASTAGR